jgi:hypothetical protein
MSKNRKWRKPKSRKKTKTSKTEKKTEETTESGTRPEVSRKPFTAVVAKWAGPTYRALSGTPDSARYKRRIGFAGLAFVGGRGLD